MNFSEEDIKRTGLPRDVMELIHDLCYHVSNNLRGTLDDRAVENYVVRAQNILKLDKCEKCDGIDGKHSINCPLLGDLILKYCNECHRKITGVPINW